MESVHTAWVESPIGSFRIASTDQGLGYVELPRANGRGMDGWLRRCLPDAKVDHDDVFNRAAAKQIVEYLRGERTDFELPLDLRGTHFQRQVWAALLEIPYGETRSYQEIARSIRKPQALQAVGAANGANPVSLVVPCHRVVASGGKLGGYRGGLELKLRLLAMERADHLGQGCLL